MIAALVIVGVLGIGLPAGLFFVARWRSSKPFQVWEPRQDDISRWLSSEFQLNESRRGRVRRIVLGGGRMDPALETPARALAARVLADQFRSLRLTRRLGWAQAGLGVVLSVAAIVLFIGGWYRVSNSAPIVAFYAVLTAIGGPVNGVIVPRRIRRNAERVLDGAAGQPTASQ